MTSEQIDAVAQGRVWTGQQAKQRGLVDRLGSYSDAIKAAATRAKIGGSYTVSYIEVEPTGIDRFLRLFDVSTQMAMSKYLGLAGMTTGIPPAALKDMTQDMRWLAELTDRSKAFSVVTHCMCSIP